MRRRTARPFGQSTSGMRLMSMIMALLVLWMLYNRLKDPATWRLIADDREERVTPSETAKKAADAVEPENEVRSLGSNDLDPDEMAAMQDLFEAVDDRAPLKNREMDAYWRLMDWSLTQPFKQLEERAKEDVPFTQLWDQPGKYRGKLIRLRMHVRRVLEFDDAPENASDVKKVYEAWGWTDESKSFPYVVVFPAPLEGLPIGTDVRAEIVFVGYFFKIMSYKAFDNTRGAPLLIGRAHLIPRPKAFDSSKSDPWMLPAVAIAGTCFIGFSIWTNRRARRKVRATDLPGELADVTAAPDFGADNPFSGFDADRRPSRPAILVVEQSSRPEPVAESKPPSSDASTATATPETVLVPPVETKPQ